MRSNNKINGDILPDPYSFIGGLLPFVYVTFHVLIILSSVQVPVHTILASYPGRAVPEKHMQGRACGWCTLFLFQKYLNMSAP